MMLYEDATVIFLCAKMDTAFAMLGPKHDNCQVTITDAGVAEIIIPHRKETIITHMTNIVVISDLETVDPEPDDGNIDVITINEHKYCNECRQMIHKDLWDQHVQTCWPVF